MAVRKTLLSKSGEIFCSKRATGKSRRGCGAKTTSLLWNVQHLLALNTVYILEGFLNIPCTHWTNVFPSTPFAFPWSKHLSDNRLYLPSPFTSHLQFGGARGAHGRTGRHFAWAYWLNRRGTGSLGGKGYRSRQNQENVSEHLSLESCQQALTRTSGMSIMANVVAMRKISDPKAFT